ncbi:hypothetical protein, partial [Pseudomonas sp. FW300-N1A1]|uniref:hypothetical protein n=1 Tax=Pseudomonas sp. FW300-N1A1 TaxID=2075555 RepID=UPI001C478A5B
KPTTVEDLTPDGAADSFRKMKINTAKKTPSKTPPPTPPQPKKTSPIPVPASQEPIAGPSHFIDFSQFQPGTPPPVLKIGYPDEKVWFPINHGHLTGWLRGSKVQEAQQEMLNARAQHRKPIIEHLLD